MTVTGTAEPGATIALEIDGTTVVATNAPVVADADGNWSATIAAAHIPTTEGDFDIDATATDAAGNTQTVKEVIEIDTVAPSLTITTPDNQTIDRDDVPNGISLSGTAESGATVEVTFAEPNGDTVVKTVITDDDGNWNVELLPEEVPTIDGNLTATVKATDAAGNEAAAPTHTFVLDTAYFVEIQSVSYTGDEDGIINADEHGTNVTVTGVTDANATVDLKIGGIIVPSVTADGAGNWTATISAGVIPTGDTTVAIEATVTDASGTPQTSTQDINIDTVAPTLNTTTANNQTVNLEDAQSGISLNGTAESGATVEVTFKTDTDTIATKTVTADGSGNWTLTLPSDEAPTIEGDLTATIVATDTAGNTTTETRTFALDTVTPDAPNITSMGANTSGGAITHHTSVSLPQSGNRNEVYWVKANGDDVLLDSAGPLSNPDPNTNLQLMFNQSVSYGEDLVVTSTDDNGNTTSTLILTDANVDITANNNSNKYDDFNIEIIDLTQANVTMTITEDDLKDLSKFSDDLVVRGGAGDTVTAVGAVSTNQATKIDGEWYEIYTLGDDGARLLIHDDINVIT